MTRHTLDGGTDTAQIGLFDIDALGAAAPSSQEVVTLQAQRRLVSIDTGADGAYRASLYVDERPPEALLQYCTRERTVTGTLSLPQGRLGFGGLETAFATFRPNKNIRADVRIESGDYDVTWYDPDYPESMTDMWECLTDEELRIIRAPVPFRIAAWACVVAVVVAAIFLHLPWLWLIALGLVIADVIGMRLYRSRPRGVAIRKRLEEGQERLNRDYPGYIVELRKRA